MRLRSRFLALLCTIVSAVGLHAEEAAPAFAVDAKAVHAGEVIRLPREWMFRARPDAPPVRMDVALDPGHVPGAWNGEGWFSILLDVPEALVNESLALDVDAPGVAEILVDGRHLATRGGLAMTWRDALVPLRLSMPGRHELTLHYTNGLSRELERAGRSAGVTVRIGSVEAIESATIAVSRRASFAVWFFATVFLSFGLLHFCLWIFQRDAVDNLWFAGLCLSNASLVFFLFYKELTTNQRFMLISEPVMNICGVLFGICVVRFVYGVFPWRYGRHVLRAMIGTGAAIAVWSVIHTWKALPFVFLFMLLSCVEVVRVVVVAWWNGRSGARLIGFGVLALAVAFGLALLRNLNLIPEGILPGHDLIPFASMVVLIATMSLYLSREFAHTNRELRKQLVEVARLSEETIEHERRAQKKETERQLLEAEYHRKSAELEEARALQMSMLPLGVPLHDRLEIATWIATATEVGGDYYDFVSDDGVLLLGIGDATGHGMRAGTMVTAIKALFGILGNVDLAREMTHSNQALRRMNFRRLAMAFTLARFDESQMRLSSAGMPPVYVRRTGGAVESHELPGSPLGALASFPYHQIEVPLSGGDLILFMSDGLPELLNEHSEMAGYERIESLLRSTEAASAQDLIAELVAFADEWKGSRPQDDDITFVVVKIKERAC